MKISIALSVVNKDGTRSKEGDIICVRPAGWEWGTEERKRFLIVEVNLGTSIATIEDAHKLEVPLFETGELWWPSDTDKDGNPIEPPKIIGKRRYNIPFTDLASRTTFVDWIKVVNQDIDYQPIEKTTLAFTNLILDKVVNKKLTTANLTTIKLIGK